MVFVNTKTLFLESPASQDNTSWFTKSVNSV